MAKTLYRVYGVELQQPLPDIDGGGLKNPHRLVYMGEAEVSSSRQAVALVVTEPRESTEYVAIPVRNITAHTPKFKPATVSWQ